MSSILAYVAACIPVVQPTYVVPVVSTGTWGIPYVIPEEYQANQAYYSVPVQQRAPEPAMPLQTQPSVQPQGSVINKLASAVQRSLGPGVGPLEITSVTIRSTQPAERIETQVTSGPAVLEEQTEAPSAEDKTKSPVLTIKELEETKTVTDRMAHDFGLAAEVDAAGITTSSNRTLKGTQILKERVVGGGEDYIVQDITLKHTFGPPDAEEVNVEISETNAKSDVQN